MAQNKFVKFSIITFIIGGLILLFGKGEWFPEFYNPQFMGIMGLISAFLIVLPRLIFRQNQSYEVKPRKIEALDFIQNSLAIVLLLNAAGALGLFQLYKVGFEYDKLLHFIVPAVSVFALVYFSFYWYQVKFGKSLFLAIISVFLLGFVWELFELFGDRNFGTEMLGYYGEFVNKDTFWDLALNVLGIAAGAIVSIKKINRITI